MVSKNLLFHLSIFSDEFNNLVLCMEKFRKLLHHAYTAKNKHNIILYLSNFSIIQSFLLYSHRLVYSAKPSLLHHAYKEAIYLSLSNVNCW